ncbi:MAG: glycosyltransferase family 4 protein, partial [Gemmatimonadota bacterium]
MILSVDHSAETASAIPSAQATGDGVPRFHVPAIDHPDWMAAQAAEANGGVSADVRAFLDMQIETGDVVVDLDPGLGFVALGATTSPGGIPTVFVSGLSDDRLQQLQDAAADAGGWLESIDWETETDAAGLLDARLDTAGRVIVHVASAGVPLVCARLQGMIAAGRVLAICISDAPDASAEEFEWPGALAALRAVAMAPMAMAERDGDIVMLPVDGAPVSAVIALPSMLVGSDRAPDEAAALMDEPQAVVAIEDTALEAVAPHSAALETVASETVAPRAIESFAHARWSALRDGFSLIAPHSRTGYGVAGAQLLRAMQALDVPVTLFPMGPIDRTLTDNPRLRAALNAQTTYRDDVPSVRLAQQFDLALHVGRGPRVGFTIFELDTFSDRERHHMARQDALVVCSEWARQVCLENGLTERPIHVVPLGVDRAVFHEGVTGAQRGNDTVFLQVGKLEPRKGQLELLRAFEDAFTPKDDVRLVLACANPFMPRAELEAMQRPFMQSRMASRITLHTTELPSQHDVARLMAGADCGVFAARAEGWNLEALEMLSMG